MNRPPMLPEEAQEILDGLDWLADINHLERALETIAAMRVEEYPTIVDTETNGGAYETIMKRRLVTSWH